MAATPQPHCACSPPPGAVQLSEHVQAEAGAGADGDKEAQAARKAVLARMAAACESVCSNLWAETPPAYHPLKYGWAAASCTRACAPRRYGGPPSPAATVPSTLVPARILHRLSAPGCPCPWLPPLLHRSEWDGRQLAPDLAALRAMLHALRASEHLDAEGHRSLGHVLEGHLPYKLWVSHEVAVGNSPALGNRLLLGMLPSKCLK